MKVIGFRSSTKCIRYAILELDGAGGTLLNANDETRLLYPAGIDDIQDRLVWVADEIDGIFHRNKDIEKSVVKVNEYVNETKAKRSSSYVDAVIMLGCARAKIPVEAKIYGSIGATSAKVKGIAEHRVGKTDKYWDNQMADAIMAALSGRKK